MPTYEYECRHCTHKFEKFQSMSDEPVRVCPKCGHDVRRVIGGGTGVIFKGSGFYVTDSKRASAATSGSVSRKSESRTASEAKAGSVAPSGEKSKDPSREASKDSPKDSAKKSAKESA